MQTKDYILITISCCAFILSIVSLIITLVQKAKETNRTIRKTLTDTLESVTKINIETTKLKASLGAEYNSESNILLRRNFNSQRRILVAHAEYLVKKYDRLTTDADYNILAGAYGFIGDLWKAEYFWLKTIQKSISAPLRLMNLRGFAIFLFNNNRAVEGRDHFQKALSIDLKEHDENKILKGDTYLMWGELEKEFGTKEFCTVALAKAMEIWKSIQNERKQIEFAIRIRSRLPEFDALNTTDEN